MQAAAAHHHHLSPPLTSPISQSPRLYNAYANEFGFNSEPILPNKGTIVIVDTNGFHHRGYATPGTDRSWYTTSWRHMGITWGPLGPPRRNPSSTSHISITGTGMVDGRALPRERFAI